MSLPRFMISAPASGSGKTLVTCGILQALVNRGLRVASFKCGPDYIDPMFHSRVIGARSKNLDAFFVDDATLRYLFGRTAEQCDISVVEGVMGFYDGATFDGTFASSCDVSLRLGIPAVLLVNARGASLSAAAVLKGFKEFAPNGIKGVIFNQMSEKVYSVVAPIAESMGVRPLGYVPKLNDLVLESRHLGLVLPGEIEELKDKLNRLAAKLEETLDIDGIIELANGAGELEYDPPAVGRIDGRVRIGLADDDAFCFTYEDNIELLERCGAEIVRFSPLNDDRLPEVDGIVLSGGYPELHAEKLESNASMREDIRRSIEAGMPCIAECGGFMYLHERMEDSGGSERRMVGAVHGRTWNTGKLCRFGYVTLHPRRPDSVMPGVEVKGHEFHYWDSDCNGDDWEAVKRGKSYGCINDDGSLMAGFPHLYYYSDPRSALEFVKRCAAYRDAKEPEEDDAGRPARYPSDAHHAVTDPLIGVTCDLPVGDGLLRFDGLVEAYSRERLGMDLDRGSYGDPGESGASREGRAAETCHCRRHFENPLHAGRASEERIAFHVVQDPVDGAVDRIAFVYIDAGDGGRIEGGRRYIDDIRRDGDRVCTGCRERMSAYGRDPVQTNLSCNRRHDGDQCSVVRCHQTFEIRIATSFGKNKGLQGAATEERRISDRFHSSLEDHGDQRTASGEDVRAQDLHGIGDDRADDLRLVERRIPYPHHGIRDMHGVGIHIEEGQVADSADHVCSSVYGNGRRDSDGSAGDPV